MDYVISHKLLQHYWHDDRCDIGKVRVWYIDRGADISLEPSSMNIRTTDGGKPVPYHRILLITYEGKIESGNQKVQGLAYQLIEKSHHMS